jgi:hypothetical protein
MGGVRMATPFFSSDCVSVPRDVYSDLKFFCLFIGYPRSGHSLIGSLLDAHPDIVISHEANVVAMVKEGNKDTEVFRTILENSRRYAVAGRQESGYSYAVPGQWQGRFRKLTVIGDKKGGRTSLILHEDPSLLDKLVATLNGLPLKMLHVTRNPFDNIATMFVRKQAPTLDAAIDLYFVMAQAVAEAKNRVDLGAMLDVRHESIIRDPAAELKRMCAFLGVVAEPAYMQSCAQIVFKKPNNTRHLVQWTDSQKNGVLSRIQSVSFLEGYALDA